MKTHRYRPSWPGVFVLHLWIIASLALTTPTAHAHDPAGPVRDDSAKPEHINSKEDQAAVLEEMRKNCEELMKAEEQELKNRNSPRNLGDEAIANDTDVHTKTLDSAENENGIVGMRENGLGDTKENESMGVFCATTFDDVYCWPRTPADTVVTIPCPQYVQGFKHMSEASRYCTREGSWFKLGGSNKSWTNYSQCSPTMVVADPVNVLYTWAPVVRTMSCVGYSVSLATLIVAFGVLACVKRLRCPRNTLHMHLFFSFICRALGALARDQYGAVGNQEPLQDGGTWGCRLFTSLWQYFILANYAWILMEGLYLHNLIFLALFTDNSAITLYIVLGWGLPLLLVLGWVTARLLVENTLCWLTNTQPWVFWTFIRGPITVSIVVSFTLFLNIARELLLKIRSSTTPESRKYRYRRWARSTLVLVPLFGVHYAALLGFTYFMGKNHTIELIWLFTDQFFASFQGFFVATLYCLLNAEVRSELRKIWHHWRMKQEAEKSMIFHSAFSQSRTYFSRGTGMPCLANAAHRKKDGGNPPTGSPPGLLTNATKVNGAPVQPSFQASHRSSSCDDLPDQSLTVSLAVVELQQRRRMHYTNLSGYSAFIYPEQKSSLLLRFMLQDKAQIATNRPVVSEPVTPTTSSCKVYNRITHSHSIKQHEEEITRQFEGKTVCNTQKFNT
ncbi:secretin receptor-like [Penaeus monodon]|uniref:secretin receptor-like n=1 Tax=Penaeus monodon TaxID=6687 RepID=UPI0018A739CB|nr:secretin receptor-like [Penaeus monodon]